MTKQEIIEFIKETKELGLKSIEVDGVKVEFSDKQQSLKVNESIEDKDLVADLPKWEQLTDEEILFWSSDYGLELENKKREEYERSLKVKNSNEYT